MSRYWELSILWLGYLLSITSINVAKTYRNEPVMEFGFIIKWWFVVFLICVIIGLDFLSRYFDKVIE